MSCGCGRSLRQDDVRNDRNIATATPAVITISTNTSIHVCKCFLSNIVHLSSPISLVMLFDRMPAKNVVKGIELVYIQCRIDWRKVY